MTFDEIDVLVTEADPARHAVIPSGTSAEAKWRYRQLAAGCGGEPRHHGRRHVPVTGAAIAVPVAAVLVAAVLAVVLAVVLLMVPGPGGPTSAAAAVLDQAATAAGQAAPLSTGQYLYTETQSEYQMTDYAPPASAATAGLTEVSTARYGVTDQAWTDSGGSTTALPTVGALQFPSAADEAVWQQQGLGGVRTPLPPRFAGSATRIPEPAGPDVSGLPTDPTTLQAALATGDVGVYSTYLTGPDAVFERAAALLIGPDRGMTPALAKALFQVMANQPGIDLLGTVTDHSGQQGEAVTRSAAGTGRTGRVTEVVVDPGTGRLLEARFEPPPAILPLTGCPTLSGPVSGAAAPRCLRPTSSSSNAPVWTDVVAEGVVGSPTATLPAVPGAAVTLTLVPGAPTDLVVTPGAGGAVSLSWAAPTDAGAGPVTGYVIRRYSGPGRSGDGGTTGTAVSTAYSSSPADSYTWTHPGGIPTGTYTYTVQAVNVDGTGPASAPVTVAS